MNAAVRGKLAAVRAALLDEVARLTPATEWHSIMTPAEIEAVVWILEDLDALDEKMGLLMKGNIIELHARRAAGK